MKTYIPFFAAIVLGFALFSANVSATTRYVNVNNASPVSPYTSWATAATNIQNAVDAATSGDLVLVTNGVYKTGGRRWFDSGTNRVTLTNAVTLQSVNGPAVTFIVGNRVVGAGLALTNAARCVGMGNNAVLSGFTLTNGEAGWGNYPIGGGVANLVGGFPPAGIVTNCILVGNLATNSNGGGAYRVRLINCQLTKNSASYGGGASSCALINCLVVSNAATFGGGVYGDSTVGASTLTNCTIVGNSASTSGGGVNNGGSGLMYNCVVFYNSAPSGSNYTNIKINYCCTSPVLAVDYPTSFSNAPVFMNLAGGDFHLSPPSPCINAGNNSSAASGTDLDGNPRLVGGVVDIGAYEFQSPIHYVNVSNSAPVSPFANWMTAATNIQDAVDVSTNGDLVLVTNGIYAFGGQDVYGSNRVAVTKPITVQSVNGSVATIIRGETNGVHVRCVYLTNGAALIGFTLTNGSASASYSGGGVLSSGFNTTTISNCLIIGNSASDGGGATGGILYYCTITRNSANGGGGIFAATVNNCIVSSNSADSGGGSYSGTAYNCQFLNNQAANGGAGYNSSFQGCLLTGNVVTGSFGGGGAYQSTLINCTVVSNRCTSFNGGIVGGTLNCGALISCIIYNNTSLSHASTPNYSGGGFLYNCCTTPLPPGGPGNFTFDPIFINPSVGDFHLQSNSPCINAGNNTYVSLANDLDGNSRVVGSAVDVGAYEFQLPSSVLSYAWAQQFGLPTYGSADFTDSDSDGLNNWQEWIAGTVPTDSTSVLLMGSPSNAVSGVTITWQSVSGKNYFLQRATDLSTQPAFSSIQSNVVGQAGTTTYMDTTATNSGPYFYRVGVQ